MAEGGGVERGHLYPSRASSDKDEPLSRDQAREETWGFPASLPPTRIFSFGLLRNMRLLRRISAKPSTHLVGKKQFAMGSWEEMTVAITVDSLQIERRYKNQSTSRQGPVASNVLDGICPPRIRIKNGSAAKSGELRGKPLGATL